MIRLFGSNPIGAWIERRRALKDMRRIMSVDAEQIAMQDNNPLSRAKVALELGDLKTARDSLALAREKTPMFVLTSPVTVEVLLGLGDLDELDAFALAGAKRFPHQPHYLEGYAIAAMRRHDMEEAVRRWAVVRKKFRNSKRSYIDCADCLLSLGRLDAADALLKRAMQIFPNDVATLIVHSRVSELRQDWTEAYRRWDALRSRHVAGLIGAARALYKLGRTAEAETLLAEGRYRFPLESGIAILRAVMVEEAGDQVEAAKRWAEVRQRFPFERVGYVDGMACLRKQQLWPEADAVALAAIERFPGHAWPWTEYANLANVRGDWAEAAERWAKLRAAFPDREDGYQREVEALVASGQSEKADRLRTEQRARFARPEGAQ
jgi:tetratricopeptide (TPR) repeat protein